MTTLQPVRRRVSPLSTRPRSLGATRIAFAAVCLAVGAVVALSLTGDASDAIGWVVSVLPLVLLAALVAPVMFAVAKRPQLGVLLLAALVPFYGLLTIVPGKPPFAEGWKEALALYVLFWASFNTPKQVWLKRRFPKVVQPAFAYLCIGLASAVSIGGARGFVGIKVDFFWMLLGLSVWRAPLDARDRDRLVSILMIDGLLTSIIGLAQQAIGFERLHSWGYSYDSNIRFTGHFLRSFSSMATPFNFGFYLTFVILIALPQCLDDPKRSRNIGFFCALPIIGLALAFTFVRGAWTALAVGLTYMAVRRYKVLLLVAPIALVALIVLPGRFSESAFSNGSFNDRQVGWAQNINKAVSAPFGNGIGTTGASGAKADEVTRSTTFVYEPDNQYFKALYEIGVLGLWALVFLLIAVLLEGRRAERALVGSDHALAVGFCAHVLGAMAAATVSTWLEIFPNDLYLWLTLAVLLTTMRAQRLSVSV